MRKGRRRITPQQAKFAASFATTNDREYSARKAGYQALAQSASENLRNPDVLAAIRRESEARITGKLLPLSIDTAERMLTDPDVADTSKTKIIQICIEHGLGKKAPALEKDPESMTLAELQAHKADLQRMLEEARRPVLELEAQPEDGDIFG
jgi:hypothetical protein